MATYPALRHVWLMMPVLMAACSSVSIEDAVPGARNTGSYPNINIPSQAATQQLTDEEATSRLAALQSQREQQNSQDATQASEVERLRKLQRSHALEAIEEIEK